MFIALDVASSLGARLQHDFTICDVALGCVQCMAGPLVC